MCVGLWGVYVSVYQQLLDTLSLPATAWMFMPVCLSCVPADRLCVLLCGPVPCPPPPPLPCSQQLTQACVCLRACLAACS